MRPEVHSRPGLGTFGAGLMVAVLAACGAGQALGFKSAPPSVGPDSPKLVASDVAFDKSELRVVAGSPFILVFENREDLDHNVSIYADELARQSVLNGVIFKVGTRWYPVPALAPGRYLFQCDVHPNMKGHLFVS
jgi:plastocyanin